MSSSLVGAFIMASTAAADWPAAERAMQLLETHFDSGNTHIKHRIIDGATGHLVPLAGDLLKTIARTYASDTQKYAVNAFRDKVLTDFVTWYDMLHHDEKTAVMNDHALTLGEVVNRYMSQGQQKTYDWLPARYALIALETKFHPKNPIASARIVDGEGSLHSDVVRLLNIISERWGQPDSQNQVIKKKREKFGNAFASWADGLLEEEVAMIVQTYPLSIAKILQEHTPGMNGAFHRAGHVPFTAHEDDKASATEAGVPSSRKINPLRDALRPVPVTAAGRTAFGIRMIMRRQRLKREESAPFSEPSETISEPSVP